MSLQNISYCRYLTDVSEEWKPDHYRARNLVRAVKGDTFAGYANFKIDGKMVTLDTHSPQIATDWFVDRVATQTTFAAGPIILCPIPDSQCTPTSTHVSRTLALAHALARRIPKLQVWQGIRFKKPVQKKIRDEQILFAAMVCGGPIPAGGIILLDDVCTTGAHAKAAQMCLQANGFNNGIIAMSLARRTHDASVKVFGMQIDSL
jgi:hypothetical protein